MTIRDLRKLVFKSNEDHMSLTRGGATAHLYEHYFGPNGEKLDPDMYDLGLHGTVKVTRNFWSKGYYCALSGDKKVDPKLGMPLTLLNEEGMTVGELLTLLKKKVEPGSRIILQVMWPSKSKYFAP